MCVVLYVALLLSIILLLFAPHLMEHIGWLVRLSVLDTEVDGSNPGNSMMSP